MAFVTGNFPLKVNIRPYKWLQIKMTLWYLVPALSGSVTLWSIISLWLWLCANSFHSSSHSWLVQSITRIDWNRMTIWTVVGSLIVSKCCYMPYCTSAHADVCDSFKKSQKLQFNNAAVERKVKTTVWLLTGCIAGGLGCCLFISAVVLIRTNASLPH